MGLDEAARALERQRLEDNKPRFMPGDRVLVAAHPPDKVGPSKDRIMVVCNGDLRCFLQGLDSFRGMAGGLHAHPPEQPSDECFHVELWSHLR